ncbi:hypothetical protein J3R83DRAFT_12287 [Lanmaoa asiatica]|nr:hypothetical protein J3R83DRAFT_12287 [Lanmaoa asiatica]
MRYSTISSCLFLCAFASSGLCAAIPTATTTHAKPVGALLMNRIHEEVNPKGRGPVEDLSWSTAIATLASVLVVSRVFKLVRALKAVGSLPGLRIAFEPFSVLAIILPETWWNPSLLFTWTWRKTKNGIHVSSPIVLGSPPLVYIRYGCDTVSVVPFLSGSPSIYTRSMEVGKQIVVAGHRSGAFGKADNMGRFFLFWGLNIVSAEGDLWRKHRRIASPAFNNDTYTFVWDASRKLYAEMSSAEGWATKDVIEVPSVHVLTFKASFFTLIIFASVGFGFPFTWANPPAQQGEMSIQECMEIITKTNIFAIAAPAWAWKLPFAWSVLASFCVQKTLEICGRVRRTRRAYETMRAFMYSLVSATRETIRSEAEDTTSKRARDLFTLLVRASEDAGGKMGLSDNELVSKTRCLHRYQRLTKTTAQSLAATLAFLALDSDLQDELVAQVQEVTRGRDDDTLLLEDYGKLDKVLAAFYEGIRMFPSGVFLVREVKYDTVLDISDGGEPRMLSVKKGTNVKYNPRYFSEPDEFRASRWYRRQRDLDEKDELEEYTAFSIGPRACLGRKFASTEGVCFLASLLRDWRVEPLLAMQTNGRVETVDEWRGRVLQATIDLTLGIHDVPLRFIVSCSLYFSPIALAQYTPSPRWAQAVALLESTLYVHGGLSDPFNSYSYSSAPEISDLLVLDLSTSFNSSSPPWQLVSSNSSPALAWHTLSAINPTELLLFGGQPDPNSLTVLTTLNDSSGLLSTSDKSSPSFIMEPQNWVNEPMRRIRHSSSYTGGKVWIIGGEKADGSGNGFSEHYLFSPSSPEFSQLPSSRSAPPDIYGHASLVLPDGRLLILGGYCASCSGLVPMSTVWSLNTTQNPLVWEKLSISNKSLPSPRRDFAAVVLSNGQVLIHGGGDSQLQTTYSDGWILNTGQNPMVWTSVAALAQLGQRKDHLAVQAGGYVLFCFGYGSSSPASAALFIYNPAISSMVTSYTAPSPGSTPVIASLAPTQTGSNPNSNGGTSTASPGGSSGPPSNTSGSSSGSSDRTLAIALGTTFGVLGLVAGGLVMVYYWKRVHNRDRRAARKFFPLADDPELSSEGSMGGAAPEAAHLDGQTDERVRWIDSPGVITDILAHLGISKFSTSSRQPRRDMFADEDTRSFGWTGHPSTVQRLGSEGPSVWSLRSVSALVRGVIGREPSGSGIDHEWEKVDHLREGGRQGLIRQGSLRSDYSSHPTHQGDGSFWSYTDPFEDPLPDDEYDGLNLRHGIPEKDADYDNFVPRSDETDDYDLTALGPQDSAWPFSVRPHMLTPLREVSHTTLSDPSNSLPSLQEPSHGQISYGHADDAALSPPASTSPTCHSPTASRFSDTHPVTSPPRHSTISGSTLSPSPSLSRPDGWWLRLTKSPLLDRRTSITSSKPLDFRDPTPAPPLVPLEDTKKSSPTPVRSNDTPVDIPVEHGRSVSSAHSGRTANTDSAEHLGGSYDVVQRLASDGSGSRRAPSLGSAEITEQGIFVVDNHAPSEISLSCGPPHADPPPLTLAPASPATYMDVETPSARLMLPKSNLPSSKGGAIVSSRVRAYERRLSRELESQQIPPLRNTLHREEVPSRTRPTIQYGVAPRASLFIANPDCGHIS